MNYFDVLLHQTIFIIISVHMDNYMTYLGLDAANSGEKCLE